LSARYAGGGVGGVFTPALVIGGAFGSAVGVGLNALFPGLGVEPIAFGLVGMAALVGGATHAPLTAIFMVLEMTNDYGLILPLMLGGTLAYVVAKRLHPESIYTEWLARRGESISHGTDEGVLRSLTVQDAYRNDPTIVLADATLASTLPTLSTPTTWLWGFSPGRISRTRWQTPTSRETLTSAISPIRSAKGSP